MRLSSSLSLSLSPWNRENGILGGKSGYVIKREFFPEDNGWLRRRNCSFELLIRDIRIEASPLVKAVQVYRAFRFFLRFLGDAAAKRLIEQDD